jgi:AcrR family transcriptional regulator
MPPTRKMPASPRKRSTRPRPGAGTVGVAKPTQRERLIEAIVELSGQLGYQSLSIAQISARAGVSSATFYEQFSDREECLLEAYRALTGQMLMRLERSLQAGEWATAARAAFGELIDGVRTDPDAGRLMFVEALSGGPRLRSELAAILDGLEQGAEALLERPPAGGYTLDLPARALIGAVRHVVSRHLRTHNEDRLDLVTDDMLAWLACYAVPADAGRWSVKALLPAAIAPPATETPGTERLPRGRHGLSAGAVARNQRARILQATAEVTMAKGFANTTVADIVAGAGVAKDAFYRHFADKQDAFLEAQRSPSQFILDTLVGAYFSADAWQERVWRALGRLLELIAANPAMSHLRLVECYTAGPTAIRRAEDATRSFTIFLEEGYRQPGAPADLPHLSSQAIAGAVFELVQKDVAAGATAQVGRRLPQLAYIATAPFLGPAGAIEAIEARLQEDTTGSLLES